MLETEITQKIKNYLKTVPNCFFWKEHGGAYGTDGIPDLICCIDGKFVALEVKTEKGKPTVLQVITMRKIQSAGGTAEIVRSVEDVKNILEKLR